MSTKLDAFSKKTTESSASLSNIGSNIKLAAATAAMGSFATSMEEGGREGLELTKVLGEMQSEQLTDKDIGRWDNLKGLAMDTAGAIGNIVGLIPGGKTVVDGALAPFSATAKSVQDMKNLEIAVNKQAQGYDEIIAKMKALDALRESESKKAAANLFLVDRMKDITNLVNKAKEDGAAQFEKNAEAESDALLDQNGLADKQVQLVRAKLEIERKNAELAEKVKNKYHKTDEQGVKILAAGIKLNEAENEVATRGVKIAIDKDRAEKDRADTLEKLGITIDDELSSSRATQASLIRQLKTMREMKLEGSLAYAQNKLALKVERDKYEQIQHNREVSEQAASDDVANLNAELAGNKRNADLLKNELEINKQIVEAKRAGNIEVVKKLREQKALNELEIKAQAILKKPAERREDRKQQRLHDHAIRTAAARDRAMAQAEALPGFGGRRSNEGHVSAATARARAGFVAANVAKAEKAAQPPVAMMQVASLVVAELKSK
jgi:hypothetical protein